MCESKSLSGPWRWPAALLLASALLLAGGAASLAAQEPEDPAAAPAAEPAEPAAEPAEPGAPDGAEPPAEVEPAAAPEPDEEGDEADEGRAKREERSHRHRQRRSDAQVVVGSSLVIEADETSNDVVVIGGSLTVLGEVYGDAAAVGGSVTIEGRVTGDVAAVGGSVSLGESAEVMGGAMSFGGSVMREEGGVIHGEVVEVNGPGVHWAAWPQFLHWADWGDWGRRGWLDHSPFDWALSQAWRIFLLALMVLVAFLALLIGRTPIERIGRRVEAEPWKSGLVGLATQILFVPLLLILVFFLAVSIIGIPFLFLLPFALLAIAIAVFFGYVGVALKLGDLVRERFGWSIQSPYMVLLVGLLGLQIWSLIGHMLNFNGPPLRLFAGLFLIFGFLVGYIAWTLATGAAVLTRFGTATSWSRQAAAPPAAPAGQIEAPAAAPAPPVPPAETAPSDKEPWEPEMDD